MLNVKPTHLVCGCAGLLAGLALRFDSATAAAAAATTAATTAASAATAATATALGSAIAAATPLGAEGDSRQDASSSSGSSGSSSHLSDTAAEAAAFVLQEVPKQRPYFVNVAAAHVAGLLAAFAANSITHMGQPALLYIVPSTLLTLLGTAAAKGDLARVWQFTDVPSFGVAALVLEDKKE
jgi:minor histocompatibility antigen H13